MLRNEELICNENELAGNWELCFVREYRHTKFLAPATFLSVSDMNASNAYTPSAGYKSAQ